RIFSTERAQYRADGRLLTGVRSREGLQELPDAGTFWVPLQDGLDDRLLRAVQLSVALAQIRERLGGEAHRRVPGAVQKPDERSDCRAMSGPPQGARRLEGVLRLFEQPRERRDGSRIAAATEDVDGGKGPEEASALHRGDQLI